METFTADGSSIGRVTVQFTSPVTYYIGLCTGRTSLPVQPPDVLNKTWTILKTNTTLSIECNGVEVLNYQFSDSSGSSCVPRWGGDVVKKIKFSFYDTASNSYQKKKEGMLYLLLELTQRAKTSTHTVELNC